jgi:hypothetical protein
MSAYATNSETILKRCGNLSQFIVYSMGIKNQQTAHKQNQLMIRMNHLAVEDSASIKAITVVTLVYLPASFVAVSLRSEF